MRSSHLSPLFLCIMAFSTSFVAGIYEQGKVKKNTFLEEMELIMPWELLVNKLQPFYMKKSKAGRPQIDLLLMIKTHCLQQWYNLGDPTVEKTIYDRISFQKFLDIDVLTDRIPDETTILNFRRFLERYELQTLLLEEINEFLIGQGLVVQDTTIIDATIIHASGSTKNKNKQRDPEMSHTRKGKKPYFGMKIHAGSDKQGLVHGIMASGAHLHDSNMFHVLQHGYEKYIYADSAYHSEKNMRETFNQGKQFCVNMKGSKNRKLTEEQKNMNRILSGVRSKVEHIFGVIKELRGHKKVRYKGIRKNRLQRTFLCGLQNLYRVRKQLVT